MEQFAVPLKFWFELNRLKNDEWFSLTDEIIDLIGYKCSASNDTHNRSNLMRFIRKNFEEGTDFKITQVAKTLSMINLYFLFSINAFLNK